MPKNPPFLRYQDKHGRGPFRPGVPALWADKEGASQPSVFEEFPDFMSVLPRLHARRLNAGCACEGEYGIDAYFTRGEQERLRRLGYRLHRVPANAVILVGDTQVVFATPKPLRNLPRHFRQEARA